MMTQPHPKEKSAFEPQPRAIRLGLLGLGTVGSQVYEALTKNFESLRDKTGFSFHVEKILVREKEKPRHVTVPQTLITTDPKSVLEDPGIHLVVEMLGGVEPAAAHIERALRAGKSVITANKAVMATHGEKLLTLASAKNVDLFFEASVAGAIPVLRPLQESLATDRVLEITGIVNGTTNYILSQMTHQNVTYENALKQAQKLGFAEPNPEFDISGMDAAYKTAILSSLAFGHFIKGEQVSHQGITGILPVDIQNAKELGYRIKLLAKAFCHLQELCVRVAPTLVPQTHPLYNVEGAYNAILVRGERFGDIMFYGQGAGGVPTSTAVISDIVEAAKNYALGTGGKILYRQDKSIKLQPVESMRSRFYLRLEVEDKPGTLAALAHVFAQEKVSFASVIQKENTSNTADIVFLTHLTLERAFRKAMTYVEKLSFVKSVKSIFHVE